MANEHSMSSVTKDEFTESETKISMFFKAARLKKAQLTMDCVSPMEEAELLMQRNEQYMSNMKRAKLTKVFDVLHAVKLNELRYGFKKLSKSKLKGRIVDVRNRAAEIINEMTKMQSSEEQERYLARQFVVDIFDGKYSGIVRKYMFPEDENNLNAAPWQEYCAAICMPVALLVLIYYVYVFNLSIGSRSTYLWLLLFSANTTQDIFVYQPIRFWIMFVQMNGVISADVREMCESLHARSKLLLKRRSGLVRDADCLVQHFNPACRAARMFPTLPFARLLISLNDYDIPLPKKRSNLFKKPLKAFTPLP